MSSDANTAATGPHGHASAGDNSSYPQSLDHYAHDALPMNARLLSLVHRLEERQQDPTQRDQPLPPDLKSLCDATMELQRNGKDGKYLKVETVYVLDEDGELVESIRVVVKDRVTIQPEGASAPTTLPPATLPQVLPVPPIPAPPVYSPKTLKERHNRWLPAPAKDNDCKNARWPNKPLSPGKRVMIETKETPKSYTAKRRKTEHVTTTSSETTQKAKRKAARNSSSQGAPAASLVVVNGPSTSTAAANTGRPSKSLKDVSATSSRENISSETSLALPVVPTLPRRTTRRTNAASAASTTGEESLAVASRAVDAPSATSRRGAKKTKKIVNEVQPPTSRISTETRPSSNIASGSSQRGTANVAEDTHVSPNKDSTRKISTIVNASSSASPSRRVTRSSKTSGVSYPLPVIAVASPRSSNSASSSAALIRAQPKKTASASHLPSDQRLATPALANGSVSLESSLVSLGGMFTMSSATVTSVSIALPGPDLGLPLFPGDVDVLSWVGSNKKGRETTRLNKSKGLKSPSPAPEIEDPESDDLFGGHSSDDEEPDKGEGENDIEALEQQLVAELKRVAGEEGAKDDE
ncbi:hypothetical protein BC629DRAFT_1590816 [Irpex lacteus]|nr:hypothetical protein BC629DRAFT_1590816 [Irpex lacteus]